MFPDLLEHTAARYALPISTLRAMLSAYMQQAMLGRHALLSPRIASPPTGPGAPRASIIYGIATRFLTEGADRAVLEIGSSDVLEVFARHGFAAHGVQPNADLRSRAAAALQRLDIAAHFHDVDLSEQPVSGHSFDVVICNSAIEHARDPRAMIANIGKMLKPAGVLVLGVANGQSLANAIADPHYGKFGLTIMSPPLAAQLFQALMRTTRPYDVTGFLPIAQYADMLRSLIGTVHTSANEDPRTIEAFPTLLSRLAAAFGDVMGVQGLPQHSVLRPLLQSAFATFLENAVVAYRDAVETGMPETFRENYIRKFVHLIAVKDMPGSSTGLQAGAGPLDQ